MSMMTPGELGAEFLEHAAMAHERVRIAQEEWAKGFLDEVKRNAEGYVPSDSFYSDTSDNLAEVVTECGSTAPWDFKLEYGVVADDGATGPHPHWRPAFDLKAGAELEEMMAVAVDWNQR